MRITSETDYALRILRCIASDANNIVDARTISERIGVPQQFTLKILRKLLTGGRVNSHKGSSGGYSLAKQASEITMLAVVETIDGPIEITRCLNGGYECSRSNSDKNMCYFHNIFCKINKMIASELSETTLDMAIEQ